MAVRQAHLDAVLELGHSPEIAKGLADSALKWARSAVEIIRVRESREAGAALTRPQARQSRPPAGQRAAGSRREGRAGLRVPQASAP